MAGAVSREQQLRDARELFQRAIALNVTPTEARKKVAEARWRDADRRLAARQDAVSIDGERQLAWWQR
jgi:hypothetical protein